MARSGQAGSGEGQRSGRLDRFLGDALIGAMVLLGLVFCVGAARADVSPAPRGHRDAIGIRTVQDIATNRGVLMAQVMVHLARPERGDGSGKNAA